MERIVNEGGYKEIDKGTANKVISGGVPDWCPLPDGDK
jgi:hypothetical protein